jgi:hypothetical protein
MSISRRRRIDIDDKGGMTVLEEMDTSTVVGLSGLSRKIARFWQRFSYTEGNNLFSYLADYHLLSSSSSRLIILQMRRL